MLEELLCTTRQLLYTHMPLMWNIRVQESLLALGNEWEEEIRFFKLRMGDRCLSYEFRGRQPSRASADSGRLCA